MLPGRWLGSGYYQGLRLIPWHWLNRLAQDKRFMTSEQSALKSNVHLMGELLGHIIKAHLGEDFLAQIEQIRHLSKSAREGNEADHARLVNLLKNLDDSQLVPLTRAFIQFLNLANIAEQFHTVSRQCEQNVCMSDILSDRFVRLKAGQFTP